MGENEPRTLTMTAADPPREWSQMLDQVYHGEIRVVIERDGVPVATIISPRDLERLRQFEEARAARFKVLDRIGAAFEEVTEEETEREVTRAIAAVRAENQASRSPVPTV